MTNRTPYTKADFAWAQWTAKDIKKASQEIISLKKERLAAIKKIRPENRTFENTVYALDTSNNGIIDTISKINLLQEVSPRKEIRTAAQTTIKIIEKKMIAIERDLGIWQALNEYSTLTWPKEKKHLELQDHKLFHDIFLEYKRMGFHLPKDKQSRVKKIEQELAKISNEFSQNITNYKDHILVTEEEISGLPEYYKNNLKKDKRGLYMVTLSYPDYNPFMELAHNSEKRKELAQKFLQKGGPENMELLERMVKLRGEKAKMLGYKNHADYRTEMRMAKSGDTALTFVTSLLAKVEKGGKNDLNDLQELKRKETSNKNAELYNYDVGYYGNKLQKIRFNVDSEEVRSYFPLKRVLEGTFNIYSTLFDVTFEKCNIKKNITLWHPDVELYVVKNNTGGTISYFALDLHPREGKYGHACALSIIDGRAESFKGDTYVTPFATMIANFTKPSETHPSLLSHSEVETFLHEFGHIMHCVLTKATHASQSGYHTSWDFVEAPSQMLEHWAWDKKPLTLLSSHYQTGRPLPEKILRNLIQSQRHMLRYATLRQLILGLLDLTLHTKNNPPEAGKLYRELIKKHAGLSIFKDAIFPAGFGHLAGGYDAGYYGYMWSNVYAADMFTRFAKEGILNKKTGANYRKAILEQGGSKPEIELVKEFLGRKPNNKAFLKEIGLS